ncbi:hypothetical protein BU24DRAFT_410552 [Aaosphaeria arxii CBS 175.79]|uniref:Translation initiation factor 3 N-terminal domain-containing protein n=1 Tax=Aaosphaeria arxii CBS 175.79 TaxID=1450172 RepID=A0A6A5XQ15_9PLEO|nr:uncharacterized protein BU24DRAFT_410552 [Aaosphaeria arxii CBS 175.79]KAF2014851.1 hypothetical protein BU24DRAFT_410552 [Aaosphaeria arxii CBS 175.79]
MIGKLYTTDWADVGGRRIGKVGPSSSKKLEVQKTTYGMSPLHLSSTSRALYRVFVAPPPLLSQNVLKPRTILRTIVYKKPVRRHALSDTYTIDNAITAPYINLVDLDGNFHHNFPRDQVSYDRVQNHLLLVQGAGSENDESAIPTCKIISKIDLRARQQKKLDAERRRDTGQSSGPSAKNLELNWAIAGGDLKHRLEKMKGFLRDGRKVELLLGPKRRGRAATIEECKKVVTSIRDAVAEVKGAAQSKEPEGVLGGVMTLVFEGKRLESKDKGKQ